MANNTTRNKLIFSGAGLLQLAANSSTIADAQFTPSSGTIEYNGPAQSVLSLSYHTLKCAGSGSKYLTANTTLTGDLIIAGTAMVDVSFVNNYTLTVAGNWTVTSTSFNPFVERKGTVTFNGSAGGKDATTDVSSLTVDMAGRIYAATPLGVQVFDPTGRLSGVLLPPARGEMKLLGWEKDVLVVWIGERKYTRKMNAMGK